MAIVERAEVDMQPAQQDVAKCDNQCQRQADARHGDTVARHRAHSVNGQSRPTIRLRTWRCPSWMLSGSAVPLWTEGFA